MHCTVCGSPFTTATRFCANCGAELTPGAGVGSPATAVDAQGVHRFEFHANGVELLGLYVKVFLLSLVTLGIYSFWGRMEIRRYFYRSARFAGAPFQFHGTGGEVFKGFLIALALTMALLLATSLPVLIAPGRDRTAQEAIQALMILAGYLALIPWILWGSLRFRSSRTELRGLRFSFRGGVGDCYRVYVGGILGTLLTLGIYFPFFLSSWYRYRINNLRYANTPFRYEGEDSALFGQWMLTLLLFIPTLGFSWFWWLAAKERYFRGRTTLQGLRFQSAVTGANLAFIGVTNWLLTVITLGIYYPFGQVRLMRYSFDSTTAVGRLDWQLIQAQAIEASAFGEGAGVLFELDVDAGMLGGGF
jgi:uncharacterized membrane protein YjgN (DUF898 family)